MRKFLIFILLLAGVSAFAQVDKKDVRRGNRQFAKAKYGDADISYRKGLNADSTSVASAYNLGNNLYRQGNFAEAGKYYQQAMRHIPETKSVRKQNAQGFDTYFNIGDAAIAAFQARLQKAGITTTLRASRGEDILAACGLLAGKGLKKNTPNL